jgi:3-deoxy-manno-octulosonate cytidylyltransferase (CMP-KDO synthetase)
MSRSPIPYIRDVPPDKWLDQSNFWLVVGTAAFKREALLEYLGWPETTLESLEKVEQLRFLEAGKRIYAMETRLDSIAVDVLADLERVRSIVSSQRPPTGSVKT